MDLSTALRAFVRIVERGSMTAAATDLGISQPAVSKLLRNLEEHTGARLIERNPRAMRPTAQGLALYEAAGSALAVIDSAIESVRSDVGAIRGNLRLHGPTCIGERHLHQIVAEFQDRYAAVTVELILENRTVDLIHENVDLALRMGRPVDQNLIMRRIGLSRRILVASPEYLERCGPVRVCEDLSGHDMVVTNASLSGGVLPLHKGNQKIEISVRPRLITNNAQVLVGALRTGKGIGTAQVLLVADELKNGSLIRVLPEYEIEPTEFFLVYPSSKFLRPTVRAFVDFAAPALQRVEGIY
ncbi:LysR family transcriptional regulator [Beijerinckia indica]|uniref:Transcriptional regulator, LysR family n=1 Tax=Beijerinckia indica subsp. indica (strain ATCC 9039 / DSM 1715 / NCIMB 8712) TaxID=395963 RepID=B2IDA6_BEII9|nr:LysR family transcriptional regulator [Beijerinckia indica]ACB93963.1 transcriptional regulator, LysR family [Beijerinckia indica subsp. indica ATCC 9039]